MVCVIGGFANASEALQFEWAWQHPKKSKYVRDHIKVLNRKIGPWHMVRAKIRVLHEMFHLYPWNEKELKLHWIRPGYEKFKQYEMECRPLPDNVVAQKTFIL